MTSIRRPDSPWWQWWQFGGVLSRFFSPAHKRQLCIVSLWACALSALEMLVAAAVIPYVSCLNQRCPAVLDSWLQKLEWSAIPALSTGLFLLICLKLAVQTLFSWSGARFNQQVQRDTVSRMLDGYLHLDWMSFGSESRTHYFRRCAINAVDAAYVSRQCVTLISSSLILVFLAGLMLWQYPLASTLLAVGFLALNVLSQRVLGQAQKQAAHSREIALQRWSLGMSEAFASFREIRVYQLEQFFLQHIDRSIDDLAGANIRLNLLPVLPRLILDFTVLGVLLLVVSIWVALERPLAELLPHLIFYAVVARTLLPAMMNLLSTRADLFGAMFNIELILGEFDRSAAGHTERVGIIAERSTGATYRLEGVTFRHAPQLPPVLLDTNLDIAHGSWIAIVGLSGAGKSTLMELLCGIHRPQQGEVRHTWPGAEPPGIAYLPQHVALLEGSIIQNVVFGFDQGDATRVHAALSAACLGELVARLPGGHNAQVGAEGSQLSGGERQRLALARALYREPDLLLLDEATSGLDEETETLLLSRLRSDRPEMTVVYITHRSNNLRFADRVIRLQDGAVNDVTPAP